MRQFTRRSAISAALLTSAPLGATEEPQDDELTPDQQFVMAAGMTEAEADCWKKIAEAAGALFQFQLTELHPMDQQEVASAIHIVQSKLPARPTCRQYLKLGEEARGGDTAQ